MDLATLNDKVNHAKEWILQLWQKLRSSQTATPAYADQIQTKRGNARVSRFRMILEKKATQSINVQTPRLIRRGPFSGKRIVSAKTHKKKREGNKAHPRSVTPAGRKEQKHAESVPHYDCALGRSWGKRMMNYKQSSGKKA